MTWQEDIARLLYPKIFNLNDAKRKELESMQLKIAEKNNFIEDLQEQLSDSDSKLQQINIELMDLQNSIKTEIEEYCSDRFKEVPKFAYKDKGLFKQTTFSMYPNELIYPFSFLSTVMKREVGTKSQDRKKWALMVAKYVDNKLHWTSDEDTANKLDVYQDHYASVLDPKSDCVAEHEEVWTKDGLKKAKDIELGDLMLSYDFESKKYVYKPIINLWDKGVKKVNRVHFRDGSHVDVTDEHHMLCRKSKNPADGYIKRDLKDVEYQGEWFKGKVPRAKKLPYTIKDIEWLNEDLCFVIGHFLAEGYNSKGMMYTCGYQVPFDIVPILEENNIHFKLGANGNGVPTLRFKGEFEDYLRPMLENSFNLRLPSEMLYLPENKLQAILDGYFLGDGHILHRSGFNPYDELCFSTSSFKWANQMQQISCQIGKTIKIWKQENHQGVGNKPIYRCTYYEKSEHHRDYGYAGMSETKIIKIEELGVFQTYDWEVEDTHNFFFSNGVCTAQCENHSGLVSSIEPEFAIAFGMCGKTGHAWNVFVYNNQLWCIETNSIYDFNRNARVFAYDEQEHYQIHWIFTQNKTYSCRAKPLNFGVIEK